LLSKIVYISDISQEGDAIIADPKISSLKDLKDKTVSFTETNGFSHFMVVSALESAGLSEKEVRFAIVSESEVADSIKKGQISAGHVWEPSKTRAEGQGLKTVFTAKEMPGIVVDVLIFKGKTIENRRRDVEAFLRAILEALEFVRANRDEAFNIMARNTDSTFEEVKNGWDGALHPDYALNISLMQSQSRGASLHEITGKLIKFLTDRGQLVDVPDSRNIFYP